MRLKNILIAGALFFLLRSADAADAGDRTAKFAPPPGKILCFIGQDRDAVDSYVEATGRVPAGFSVNTSIQHMDGLWDEADYGLGRQNAKYLLNKYRGTALNINLWLANGLKETADGRYDANVVKLAEWLKRLRRPVFLRIGYKFDYPPNNYDPESYVRAYRRVVDGLRAAGVDNAAYVWHSYGGQGPRPLEDWYPGDDYVDWIAVSYFTHTRNALAVVPPIAQARGKPLMVAEASPYGIGTRLGQFSWDKWFRPFFQYLRDQDVRAFCYIDCNWESLPYFQNQGWGDARVQEHDYVAKKWLEEIDGGIYLAGGPDLHEQIGYDPGPLPAVSLRRRAAEFFERVLSSLKPARPESAK